MTQYNVWLRRKQDYRKKRFAEFKEKTLREQALQENLENKSPVTVAENSHRSEYEEKASGWTQLADNQCKSCQGYGLLFLPRKKYPPCKCVFRNVFKRVLQRYYFADNDCRNVLVVSSRGITNSFPSREYRADFELICLRTIKDKFDVAVWRLHHVKRIPWDYCVRILEKMFCMKVDRWTFFRSVSRIERLCGKALYSVRPYALFPSDAYFSR